MPTLTRRSSRITTAIALPAAVIAAGVLVSTSSYAAFSDTTANEQNTWRAGSVDLADDATGRALFTVPNAKPGDGGVNCIAVTSTGSLASQVRLYAGDPQSTASLADHLVLTVEQGTGGGYGSCAGFTAEKTVFDGRLAGFGAAHSSFATGLATWSPTGAAAETRTFRLTWKLVDDAPNSVQGGTASTSFVWEAQNS
ncbi:putative ribosomally synthesized peptide with SipW-like signal peptide [Microbacterium sp. SORGH_AS 1204]|uniref:TasA family protein n=1 Tax=Microbacterium sp. SORGH_AS_1204 TaxID=3041785 RepID=UPI00278CAD73|nr:TasA family protein [Microbacterium sp. SORGH_AS_1204]MDQ1135579.1 putative ribosomally synthesized peptide with SipW-like signal peptide [Microbacterium sp. SORGH_AS_1204]